jgi:hypothetical protein
MCGIFCLMSWRMPPNSRCTRSSFPLLKGRLLCLWTGKSCRKVPCCPVHCCAPPSRDVWNNLPHIQFNVASHFVFSCVILSFSNCYLVLLPLFLKVLNKLLDLLYISYGLWLYNFAHGGAPVFSNFFGYAVVNSLFKWHGKLSIFSVSVWWWWWWVRGALLLDSLSLPSIWQLPLFPHLFLLYMHATHDKPCTNYRIVMNGSCLMSLVTV